MGLNNKATNCTQFSVNSKEKGNIYVDKRNVALSKRSKIEKDLDFIFK
jgi:hypothetical protein